MASKSYKPKTVAYGRGVDVLSFANLGFADYIASRVLFLHGHLPQAAALAATAVEKYFKSILTVRGEVARGHLSARLIRSIENYQPRLYADLDPDFLRFLDRAYELRYLDSIKPGYNIVISQFRVLAALDHTIETIDRGFSVARSGTPVESAFRQAVTTQNDDLLRENRVLLGVPPEIYALRENRVFELRVVDAGSLISVNYVVGGVRIDGGFLDREACVVGADPTRMELSRG